MNYIIYTDGSDFKHTSRRLGIGGILIRPHEGGFGEKVGEFSEELSRVDLLKEYGTSECSNPFAEMVATYRGLQRFASLFKPGDHVIFKADYVGVQGWLSGKWKANLPYIKKIRDQILGVLSKTPWTYEFQWVKGHQAKSIMTPDSYWNSEVDKLAKGNK